MPYRTFLEAGVPDDSSSSVPTSLLAGGFEMLCSWFTVHLLRKATVSAFLICTLSTDINFEEGEIEV